MPTSSSAGTMTQTPKGWLNTDRLPSDPPARGRGYCTEAVTTLTHHLFDRGIERITAEANPRNMPSLRLLEKLGFNEIEYGVKAI
jgi:RimJ/RimL family protein N-acetyltransferase